MTKLKFNPQVFSATEESLSLDSADDVKPTALFRGSSFGSTMSEAEDYRHSNLHHAAVSLGNLSTGTQRIHLCSSSGSGSGNNVNSMGLISGNNSNLERPFFANNLYPQTYNNTEKRTRSTNLYHSNNGLGASGPDRSRISPHCSSGTGSQPLEENRNMTHQVHDDYSDNGDNGDNDDFKINSNLLYENDTTIITSNLHHKRSPSLSKCSVAEAAAVLFPPPAHGQSLNQGPTTPAHHKRHNQQHHSYTENNENNLTSMSSSSYSSPNDGINLSTSSSSTHSIFISTPKYNSHHHSPIICNNNSNSNNHHHHSCTKQLHHKAPPATVMKEKNLNISHDDNTVMTDVMATTDESSFDISPVPSRSPPSKKLPTTTTTTMGSSNETMAMRNGSDSSSLGTALSSLSTMPTIVSSSKYSNSRKRTSSDRKKSKSRNTSNSTGSYDDIGGASGSVGLQPRPLFSPTPYSSHKKNGVNRNIFNPNSSSGGGSGSSCSSHGNAAFRKYRVPSIEPCHSFDSHDSNTTSCSKNDFLANTMDPNYSNTTINTTNKNHINNDTNNNSFNAHISSNITSSSKSTILNQQQESINCSNSNNTQLQYPQSANISKPTQYTTTGWSSSFTFSGSPIEEEEYEDSMSPFHHLNGKGKKPKHMDERGDRRAAGVGGRLFDCIGGGVNVDGTIRPGTNMNRDLELSHDGVDGSDGNRNGSGDDDHFSSKIRRLNLDCEMDCSTDDDDTFAIAQNNSIGGPLASLNTSLDRSRLSYGDSGSITMETHQQQHQGPGPVMDKLIPEDSFHLHVNTDFQSSLSNDMDDDTDDIMKEGNLKTEDDLISPTDVAEFTYPPSLSSISSTKQAGSSLGQPDNNAVLLRTTTRNTETPLPPPTIDEDDDAVHPPHTFSSPTPLTKKGLNEPPSPYRMGRVHNLNMPLPPTTPMVPQKAMRRMRGNNDVCPSPFLHHGLPLSDRSNRSRDCNSTQLDGKSRFHEDFEILDTLGNGSFGTVYKCRQRVDGRLYAVKAAKRRAKGNADRERMLKEVVALAELSDAAGTTAFHIVRYHQAWLEDDKLHIVTELCTSTLLDEMLSGIFAGNTKRLYKLLREMLLALKLIHKHGLVHLDIKPENIFVREDTYKLGDFGLVSEASVQDDVEEGDSRYMCMDLLSGNHKDLTKCDIFSLGITMYEIVLGTPLPAEGPEWQDLRAGRLSDTLKAQPDLQNIIKSMMDPEASRRPHAEELLTRRQLLSEEEKQLILEQNRVREANLALAFQEQRFRKLRSPKRGLTRSNTCPK